MKCTASPDLQSLHQPQSMIMIRFLYSNVRRYLVPWTARSKQSILKEINSEYSLEGLLLKLNFQYFDPLMQRRYSLKKKQKQKQKSYSLEKTLMLGKIEGKRKRGQQRMRWLDSITDSMDMILSKFQETVKDMEVWHVTVHRVAKSQT